MKAPITPAHGDRREQGRPRTKTPKSAVFQLRLTDAEHQKLKELGGAKWVRRKLAEEIHQNFKRDTDGAR